MENEHGTIGILDLGTEEQKAKLYKAEELVSAPLDVALGPTSPEMWKIYPRRNQDGSNSCVYQARAKAAGILQEQATGEFIEYSAADYAKRSNKPTPGAYPVESFDFWRTEGIGLEVLEPSQNVPDAPIENFKQSKFEGAIAKVSLLDKYYALPAMNFDMIVSTLAATKKPIPVGFFGTYEDWNRDIPTLLNPGLDLGNAVVRHEVCATPNFGIYQGLEGFTIEDSWGSTGIGGMGVRWITRAYFEKRNYIPGLVPTSFKSFSDIGVDPEKPHIALTRELEFGMTGPDVRALQAVLKFEGFFPANHAGSEYFGEITKAGVGKYQLKYGIVASETAPGFGRVGPKTKADLNDRYK